MPRLQAYAGQISKEYDWLPKLAPRLPLAVPEALAIGAPSEDYPWAWSISRWIDGEVAEPERVIDLARFARDLANFLTALHGVDAEDGPRPGAHSFYRGGPLASYDAETRKAVAALGSSIDAVAVLAVWDRSLASTWQRPAVWVHGDVSVGNLIVKSGQLCGVIDFGNLAVGDPACDLAMNWTVFKTEARDAFRHELPLDAETWARGRGWVLWKALILAAGFVNSNAYEAANPRRIIENILCDHRTNA
jgi:aminoglycoside phosphotransferase (APT) family kinase protein